MVRRVHAIPADFARQPAIFDLRTAIYDHGKARLLGAFGRIFIDDAELHPEDFGAQPVLVRDRFIRDGSGRFRIAEDVDHFDRRRNIGEAPINLLSENLFPLMPGIDRNDFEPFVQQIFHRKIGRAHFVGRGADHRDGFHASQNSRDQRIGIAGIHQSSGHLGGRLSRNAPMPSAASASSIFCTITSPT